MSDKYKSYDHIAVQEKDQNRINRYKSGSFLKKYNEQDKDNFRIFKKKKN
jgi:hypothetical protein